MNGNGRGSRSQRARSAGCKSTKPACAGLSLRRIGHSVIVEDTLSIRGMIKRADYLLEVEEMGGAAEFTWDSLSTDEAEFVRSIIDEIVIWCRNAESNRGPTDYESVALPTELFRLRPLE